MHLIKLTNLHFMLHKLQNLFTNEKKSLGKSHKINKEILAFKIINLLFLYALCILYKHKLLIKISFGQITFYSPFLIIIL